MLAEFEDIDYWVQLTGLNKQKTGPNSGGIGKNLALGGIYRLPKFLKISKQNKFPQKKYRYNIIPLYFETFNKLKSTDVV